LIQPNTNGSFVDGQYTFEVLGTLEVAQAVTTQNNDGRSASATPQQQPVGVLESGSFSISNGAVVSSNLKESE